MSYEKRLMQVRWGTERCLQTNTLQLQLATVLHIFKYILKHILKINSETSSDLSERMNPNKTTLINLKAKCVISLKNINKTQRQPYNFICTQLEKNQNNSQSSWGTNEDYACPHKKKTKTTNLLAFCGPWHTPRMSHTSSCVLNTQLLRACNSLC